LIWSNFHVVSPIAIPLNIALWPLLVMSLLSGLALAVLWWIPLLASLLGLICGASLWLVGLVVQLGDRVPGGHVWLPAPTPLWMTVFYVLAAVGIGLITAYPQRRSALGWILCGWLAVGMAPWYFGPRGLAADWVRDGVPANWNPAMPAGAGLQLTFIDVGHGTSVVAEMPSGEVWVYDAGHLGSADRSHQEIADVLWSLPTARIDRLFLSHADADHYNAVPGLLQRFAVGQVAAPAAFWQHLAPELGALRETIDARGIAREILALGDQLSCGEVQIETLHPPVDWLEKTDNANSLTLRVQYAGRSCLLPGDLEKGGLSRLLASPPRNADVLMAPHHGSLTHDPNPLIRWSQPSWIVISGGARACRPEVLQRYSIPTATTAITHRDGAIQVRITPTGLMSIWHWQENRWMQWSDR